jgi:hypothetical protein
MNFMINGQMLQAEAAGACFLYDAKDGRIIHQHEVINFPGAPRSEEKDIEAAATRVAAQMGHDTSGLKALHVKAGEYSPQKDYRVDISSGRLIEIATG